MYRQGHVGAALLAYAPAALVVGLTGALEVVLVGAVALARLPDYDQRVPGLAHRGVTHTVWFALLVGLVFGVAGGLIDTGRERLRPSAGGCSGSTSAPGRSSRTSAPTY